MTRRSGGRSARVALRSAPLAEELRPVRAGLIGGKYKPLSDSDIAAIHASALQVLEEIGLADAPPSGVEAMTAAGAVYGEDKRLRFAPAMVDAMLGQASKNITLHGRNAKHDLTLSPNKVHYGTGGAAVHIVDAKNRNYRESTLLDLYQSARLAEHLEHVHYFQRPLITRDVLDNYELDINTLYAFMSGTQKHIGISYQEISYMEGVFDLLHMAAGSEEKWRERPFASNTNCFVVPPLKFATESCLVMEACIRGGMPVLMLSAGQAGATAPASITGTIVQAVAECLAGFIYVNCIKPGAPAIFGLWPFVSDLRSGAMSGGSGEQALLTAACAQMGSFYGLPTGSAAGIADSKMPDMQAGYEKAISNVMAGLSGLNMVYESIGMHASLLGFSLESMIIDNDMIGQCLRCVRGIDVTPESLAIETMREVCLNGPGHYLGHEQTLNLMQTEYIYPVIGDRTSPKEWAEVGKPDLLEAATAEKKRILSIPNQVSLPYQIDKAIREKHPIRLPKIGSFHGMAFAE
ncbi:MAG: trimethylamine methyltransferase family protein [Hyphomicrobiales bacterium]|nr:trimethylamine methyltransferase family protein [Hyphomicrobiales bacterium]